MRDTVLINKSTVSKRVDLELVSERQERHLQDSCIFCIIETLKMTREELKQETYTQEDHQVIDDTVLMILPPVDSQRIGRLHL